MKKGLRTREDFLYTKINIAAHGCAAVVGVRWAIGYLPWIGSVEKFLAGNGCRVSAQAKDWLEAHFAEGCAGRA